MSWPEGEKSPKASHGHDGTARGAAWGSLWGVLFGALFAVPVLGLAVGGAVGAFSKAHEKLGISKEQLEKIRAELTEGTSALFLVTDQGNLDRLAERFRGMNMTLLQTNLTEVERDELLERSAPADLSSAIFSRPVSDPLIRARAAPPASPRAPGAAAGPIRTGGRGDARRPPRGQLRRRVPARRRRPTMPRSRLPADHVRRVPGDPYPRRS